MNLMCFGGEKLKTNLSTGQESPTSKFKWALFLSLFLLAWQNASAVASWEEYSDLDEITWNPDDGSIHYKIRVYQTWGGSGSGQCGWGLDGDSLKLIQNTKDKHVITIQMNDGGTSENQTFIDGRALSFNVKDEQYPDNDNVTRFLVFKVPVSQEDLGKEISIDLKGYWCRAGSAKNEDINKPSYRTITLNNPKDPELEITKVYYGCGANNNPMIYFDWTRKDTTGLNAYGVITLCEADSSTMTSMPGTKVFSPGSDLTSFSLVAYTAPYHDLSKSYTYKLRQEINIQTKANGIENILTYVSESNKVIVNAYPQVSDMNFKLNDDKLACSWNIPTAPTSNYDDGSFLLTIKKTVEDSVVSETTKEIEYEPGKTDYTYEVPVSTESAEYEFSIKRSSTKDLSCYDKLRKTKAVTLTAGKHTYPSEPHAALVSYPANIELTWKKEGVAWSEGTLFIISRTNLTTNEVKLDTLSKAEYNKLSYIDKAEPCSSYLYDILFQPAKGMDDMKLSITDTIKTKGCEDEEPVFLSILDGANGKTNMLAGTCKSYKIRFTPEENWSIGSVSFNGTDVTDQLQENLYETPEILDNSTLSVVYKKNSASPAPRITNSWLRVWVNNGSVVISNASFDSDITITNSFGEVLYSGKINSNEMTIDSLSSGIFLVEVDGEIFKVSL